MICEAGIRLLQDKAPGLTVVVKDGANGAYYSERGEARHVDGNKVEAVLNLTGAGDSFNAGFMTAVVTDRPLPEAVAYGCAVAAAKISGQTVPRL